MNAQMQGTKEDNLELGREVQVIETSSESLHPGALFNLIKDLFGFVLYMHQQIPSILQDLSLKFEALQVERKMLETEAGANVTPCLRRQHMIKKRGNQQIIKRLDKLMQSIKRFEDALTLLITQETSVERVAFILGSNPLRPLCAYELSFCNLNDLIPRNCSDLSTSKAAVMLSRKVIRTLIANGAGSVSYPGPSKIFFLIKALPSLNLPLHFTPKRDFKFSKKVNPYKIQINPKPNLSSFNPGDDSSQSSNDSNNNELIWYQCRHVVKGLMQNTSPED